MTIADELLERRNWILNNPERHVHNNYDLCGSNRSQKIQAQCLLYDCRMNRLLSHRAANWLDVWARDHGFQRATKMNDTTTTPQLLDLLDDAIRDAKEEGI
jgi:hypothetical protein